jgi:nucleoside 2-deoxyribosyltransferase
VPERISIYLAAPLFSVAERAFNVALRDDLLAFGRVFLPQEDGHLLAAMIDDGVDPVLARQIVFDRDMNAIVGCDLLVAVLDGRAVDEGVAFEIGVAYQLGRAVFGLQTDPRRLLPSGNNPMIQCALSGVDHTVEALKARLDAWTIQGKR